jgi:hypothetical protein
MNSGVVTAVPETRVSAAAGWLSWTIPLLTTELVLQGRKILHVRAKPLKGG